MRGNSSRINRISITSTRKWLLLRNHRFTERRQNESYRSPPTRFLKRSQQFVIPIYQRTYSWTEQQCRQLWDDIIRAGKRDDISAHFIGSVVYIEQGLYQVSGISPLLVIDGQQRLTTAMLLIEALSRHLGEDEVFDGFSAMKLRNYYLLNPYESGEKGFKLLLTETDKDSLLALIKQRPMPENYSHRIMENFTFFDEQIAKLGDDLILMSWVSKVINCRCGA